MAVPGSAALRKYELQIQFLPPRLFGLHDEGWLVVEAGQSASVLFNQATWSAELESQYRAEDRRISASFDISSMHIAIDDDKASVTLEAKTIKEALSIALPQLRRYCSILTTLIPWSGLPVTFHVIQAFEDGEPAPVLRELKVAGFAYELNILRRQILDAGELANGLPPDSLLDQALRYFHVGEALHTLAAVSPARGVLEPLCFLQFWKALATIVGDPSRDRDHQMRFRTIGLGKGQPSYYADTLKPLHDIRNQFDVAHIASLDTPQFVSQEDVVRCRMTAAEAIQTYAAWSKPLQVSS